MAPVELSVRIGSAEAFPVEIDDEETVEVLANVVMSMNSEITEQPRLVHKGKVLKDHQEIRGIGIQPGEFVVVVPQKPSGAAARAEAPAVAPAETAAPAAAAAAAAAPPAAAAAAPPAAAAASAGQQEPPEELVTQLCGMGFDRPLVQQALRAAFNNPERAVEYLFSGVPPEAAGPGAAPGAAPGGHWAEAMLGPQLLTKAGPQPTRQALGEPSVVALYFSAHWCPPCRQFTPMLAAALAQPVPQLKVVFVSSDRDEQSFAQYFSEMPWLALPFGSFYKESLSSAFNVRGIPSLIILNGSTGQPISADGRGDFMRNNFDIARCLAQWGVSGAASTAAPAAAAPAPASAAAAAPAPAKIAGPEPLPIDDAVADAALARIVAQEWEVQETFFKTAGKVLDNTLQNPDEVKFRQLKKSNAALQSKLLGVADNAGVDLMGLAGFEASGDEFLSLAGPPDGRCTAVRKKLQAAATAAWEKHARAERDAKIKEEIEKDKQRTTRYSGGDGERMQVGRRGPARGGGG